MSKKIMIPRSDFDKVFSYNDFGKYSNIRIIISQNLNPFTPEQNSLFFRMNGMNRSLDETIYINNFRSFISSDDNIVFKLKMSIYVLTQALRAWYKKVDN